MPFDSAIGGVTSKGSNPSPLIKFRLKGEPSMPDNTPDNSTTVRAALRFALAHPDEFAKWLDDTAINNTVSLRDSHDAPALLQQAKKLLDPNEHWTVYYP